MDLCERTISGLRAAGVRAGERVGVAVSGGADSTALLHLLVDAHAELPLDLHVLHVDHRLRPASEADALAVVGLASGLRLPCRVLCPSVDLIGGASVEAAAREARYEALEDAADELGLSRILTAHTLDDQAETVLLRMLRGTGVKGLRAIAPERGRIVRPLLAVRRQELRTYLRERGIPWLEDPSNDDLRFDRNWLRSEILPRLEARRPGVAANLARLADLARADEAALGEMAAGALRRARLPAPGVLLDGSVLAGLPAAVASRVVRCAVEELGTSADADETAELLALLDREPGVAFSGAPDLVAWRTHEGLLLLPRDLPAPGPVALAGPGTTEAEAWGVRLRVGADPAAPPWSWRCGVRSEEPLTIRARRPGDRITTRAGTRKVQDVLVDAKVPRPLRDLVPVLAAGDRPVAVVGVGPAPVPSGSGPAMLVVDADPLEGSWWKGSGWWSRARHPEK